MVSDLVEPPLRTYGNWRRPKQAGLGKLDLRVTLGMLFGVIVGIVLLIASGSNLLLALAWAAVVAGGVFAFSAEDKHGRTLMARAQARTAFAKAKREKTNVYRSGPLGFTPYGTYQLPGLAAELTVTEWEDSYGRPFALVHAPSKNRYTVVFAGEPDGASLVDQEQVDLWVAHWGQFLAALGVEPGIVSAAVTVETAPDFGARLRREVETSGSPDAPPFARAVMQEILEDYPRGSASVRAYVSLTFSGAVREAGGDRRSLEDVAHDLASRIALLAQSLGATGAGQVRPLSASELCEFVRVAYDPAVANAIGDARAQGAPIPVPWSEVGPTAAEASWASYRHDSGISRTWVMSQAPRGQVYSNVLTRLLAPHPSITRKRVTLMYKPIDPARAAALVEHDIRQANIRATSGNVPSQRAQVELAQSQRTAVEEARGAGLVEFGMLVTATVTSPEELKDAAFVVENLAASSRVLLRPMYGSQDAGFAGSLPLGIVLNDSFVVPTGFGV